MVRRQAANNLAKFVKEVPPPIVIDEMIPLFQHLAGDDQDSVRLLTVDVLISIAEEIPKEQQSSHGVLLTALRSLFEDKSWRVRYMVADRFEKIAKAVDDQVVNRDLVPAFVKLLKDSEAEVRTAIAGQIPGFCKLLGRETLLNEIMTTIEDLVSDPSQHVRAALGTQISGLAPILGKDETIAHLLPMFLQMLKDEFPDVRLHIISKLELVNNVIGIELLSQSLLPAIVQLAEDKQWRVRLAIIEYIPLLASQLGVKFFDEQLSTLCMSWLGDTVFSIREAATQNLKKLTEVFGVQWANEAIIPKVMVMGQHPNYLYRMTTCFAISVSLSSLPDSSITSLIAISRLLPLSSPWTSSKTPSCPCSIDWLPTLFQISASTSPSHTLSLSIPFLACLPKAALQNLINRENPLILRQRVKILFSRKSCRIYRNFSRMKMLTYDTLQLQLQAARVKEWRHLHDQPLFP
jgi:serine/threonine-protein phosphatase 2A regulatory subunit A